MSQRKQKWNGSKWIRQDKRLAIILRDDQFCAYCGTESDRCGLTLDHIIPVSQTDKPNNQASNLITSCKKCNDARGNTDLYIFLMDKYGGESNIVAQILDRVVVKLATPITEFRVQAKELLKENSITVFTGNGHCITR